MECVIFDVQEIAARLHKIYDSSISLVMRLASILCTINSSVLLSSIGSKQSRVIQRVTQMSITTHDMPKG